MAGAPILEGQEFVRRGPASAEGWSQLVGKGRDRESFYRERWQHDKVVRSTHGAGWPGPDRRLSGQGTRSGSEVAPMRRRPPDGTLLP